MIKNVFDKQSIDIPCPQCHKKSRKTIAWIKVHTTLRCTGCGESIALNKGDLVRGLKQADKVVNDFARRVKLLK